MWCFIVLLFAVSVSGDDIIGVNLALNKPTFDSATDGTLTADLAVNGETNVDCAVSVEGTNPWWSVKLDDVLPVSKIIIYSNPQEQAELIGTVVSVLDVDTTKLKTPDVDSLIRMSMAGTITSENYQDTPIILNLATPIYGNIVNIQLPGNEKRLTLCEVEVYADLPQCPITPVNIAEGKETSQSSTPTKWPWRRPSANAVDANRDGNLNRGRNFCTRTTSENTPWWSVKLGGMHRISKIQIFNREDCCADRLIGAVVRVIDINTDKPIATTSPMMFRDVGKVTEDNYLDQPIIFELPTPISGNVVSVSLDGKEGVLTICELEVFADCKQEIKETIPKENQLFNFIQNLLDEINKTGELL